MRLVKVDQLTGSEILARSIMTSDYKEILAEGTLLKLAYIPRLEEIGIKEVFVKDNELDAQTKLILKEEVNKKCKDKVKEIISKHMYNKSQDMTEIADAADRIITNVVNDDNVAQQIYDIRERSADLYEHSISTCTIATLVAIKMNIDDDLKHDLGIGCLLHDLGLRYVTIDYIDKDMTQVDPAVKEEYTKHPIYGYSAIKHEKWLSKVSKEIILMHHETIDGQGYPIHTPELAITTRIAAACDFFDESICGIGHERKRVHEAVEYLNSVLEEVEPEFANISREYHDGLLLFDISNHEIWERASNHPEEMEAYFRSHIKDFKFDKPCFKGVVVFCRNESDYNELKAILDVTDMSEWVDSILSFNKGEVKVRVMRSSSESGIFKQGQNAYVDKIVFGKGEFEPMKDYPYTNVVGKVLNEPEAIEDVSGEVAEAYQAYLEKEWVKKLRSKYQYRINKKVLKKVSLN